MIMILIAEFLQLLDVAILCLEFKKLMVLFFINIKILVVVSHMLHVLTP